MANTGTVNHLKAFFVDSSPITEVEFAKNEVIIPKDKRGAEGSKEYSYAYRFGSPPYRILYKRQISVSFEIKISLCMIMSWANPFAVIILRP
mgnify:CR=1 FL=1